MGIPQQILDPNSREIVNVYRWEPFDQLTISGTASSSDAVTEDSLLLLSPSAACYFIAGENPTAVATSNKLQSGSQMIYPVKAGEKISVIGSSGTLDISIASIYFK